MPAHRAGKKSTGKKKQKPETTAPPMPSLIVKNIEIEEKEPAEKKFKDLIHSHYGPKRRAARWLYFGVAVCGIAILILWGWATEMKINSIRWDNLAEKQLLEEAKRDWNQIFTETKEQETLKQKINGILSQALSTTAAPNANMAVSPTSVTATVKVGN